MKLRTLLSAAPLIRKLWRWTPRRLRLPLGVLALGAAAWYVATGQHRDDND